MLFISHLFSLAFVFHQVHLPIAPFPNDPDENIIIHHSSRHLVTLHDLRNDVISSHNCSCEDGVNNM